jgi:hypothetical protein
MLMRRVPSRIVPLFSRYGVLLFTALLLYCAFHGSILRGHDHLRTHGPGNDQSNVPKGFPLSGGGSFGKMSGAENREQTFMEDSPPPKVYKPLPEETFAPVEDPFPYLSWYHVAPPVLASNLPPAPHVEEYTPLFIGFTRNWPLLLQCVSSYIAAGWPATDIYVVENTGTFRANIDAKLTMQNPFFLNHTQLRMLGVHVVTTPALLSFAQLQNFYLYTAQQKGWGQFFWSHQDVLVFSDEEVGKNDRDHDHEVDPYATIYERAVGVLRYLQEPDAQPWATHFFAYDHLTLVNRDPYLEVGAWDTHIPFYASDCDIYLRLHWGGYWQPQSEVGLIFDVSSTLDDLAALYRVPGSHATFTNDPLFSDPERPAREIEAEQEREMWDWVHSQGETWQHLVQVAGRMQEAKWVGKGAFRNTWQTRQTGGKDEPFYRDPAGFEDGVQNLIDAGRRVFADKWGHRGCDLLDVGIDGNDMWKLERDWDINEGPGNEGGNWHKDWTGVT